MSFEAEIKHFSREIQEQTEKRKALRQVDLFVLDNSLRESTVGQLRGHTIENKRKIYNEIKRCGFQEIIVASFSHMTRLGDVFIRELKKAGEDFTKLWAFSEFLESVNKDRVPDLITIPVGLLKMKELGIKNAIIEADLVWPGLDYDKFTIDIQCKLFSDRMKWARDNLAKDARVLFNIRDLPTAMKTNPKRVLKVVRYLSSLPANERPFGIIYEESGKYLPEELQIWTTVIRKEMDNCGFNKGHLLVHVHEQWGLADMTQLECIVGGANGIWASLIVEGASMGHACSTVTLLNLIRMGNKHVLKKFNCVELRKAAQSVTRITTGVEPYNRQVVYGERALDMVFGMPMFTPNKKEFSMADFFGEKPVMRMTTLASAMMIVTRLKNMFGEDPQYIEERGQRMKEVMLEDLRASRKEEYMSKVGLAILFDRSGGKLTGEMADIIANDKPKAIHANKLIAGIRKIWDEWDMREGEKGGVANDERLQFDSFYNGFLAPYFGCYRCETTTRALKAIDMDEDGFVDWNEFAVYLHWAVREYPGAKDSEELLSIAFRKGLIPAMQDEVLQQKDG